MQAKEDKAVRLAEFIVQLSRHGRIARSAALSALDNLVYRMHREDSPKIAERIGNVFVQFCSDDLAR